MWVGGEYNIQPYVFVSVLFIYANAIIDQRTQLNNSPDIALTMDDFVAQGTRRGKRKKGYGEIASASYSYARNNLRR
jgi:hypothetical protein